MEDCNTLVADCVVICCCSQCLILQIIIFVFLKLPYKLIRKTKRYAKKLIGGRRRTKGGGKIMIELEMAKGGLFQDEVQLVRKSCNCMMSMSLELREGGFGDGEAQHGIGYCCLQEVEKVLEELSRKGEFAFGSFWGRSQDDDVASSSSYRVANYERFEFLRVELLDMSSFISSAKCQQEWTIR